MIALEALAAGVPVVASAVGGLSGLAPAAVLVRPDQPRALAAAIDQTLSEPPDADRPTRSGRPPRLEQRRAAPGEKPVSRNRRRSA